MKETITLSSVNKEVLKILDKKGMYLFDQYLAVRARRNQLPGSYNPFKNTKTRSMWLITKEAKDGIIKCAKKSDSVDYFKKELKEYL